MNRKDNIYVSDVGEVLDGNTFSQFVQSEAQRQYEECTGERFTDMTIDEQQECIISQWHHQLENRGWKCYNRSRCAK
jgi:hypothetical protein